MITREVAEQDLVEKVSSMLARNNDEQEEEVVLLPAAVVNDGEEAVEDGNEGVSSLSAVAATPAMFDIGDNLDDGKPLSTTSDVDQDPFGFFETLPVAGHSHMKH